jgi:hypothetical protein
LCKGAGGNGASIDDFQSSRHGFGSEKDLVLLGEGGVDERGRGTRVDHREDRNRKILKHEVNGYNNKFFRIKTNKRNHKGVSRRWVSRSNGAWRANWKTQRSAL